MMFKSAPGEAGNELVPDLAEALGEPSDDAKTWTYKLRQGVKFEDGTEVTVGGREVRRLRSTDKETFPNGPTYFDDFLDLPRATRVPYKTPDMNTDSAIETPDDYTIVFHLKQAVRRLRLPRAAAADRCRCPQDKDTGAKYRNTSSPPVRTSSTTYEPGKSFTLVRNPEWDPATDPNRKALPDRIEVTLNVNADDIDNRLISGDLDVDVAGTGVQPAAQSRVLSDPALKEKRGQPAQRAALVHLDQPDGGAARQHRVPQGDHVRDGPHRPTRPPTAAQFAGGDICHDDAAAADPGLPEASTSTRPVRTTRATSTRPRRH